MVLNVFNRLINITKENEGVQNFIKELSEFIEENFLKNDTKKIPKKEQSLIQELLEQNKLTTTYSDKMHVARANILYDYAKQTADKGEMYYIYNKDDNEVDTYHLCICDKENSHKVIEAQGSNLPAGVGLVIGALIISFLINKLIKKYYTITFSIIFGLFLSIIPNVLNSSCVLGFNMNSLISILLVIVGFGFSFFLGNVKENVNKLKALFKQLNTTLQKILADNKNKGISDDQ